MKVASILSRCRIAAFLAVLSACGGGGSAGAGNAAEVTPTPALLNTGCVSASKAGHVVAGHRGLPVAAPENTLASFRAAIAGGAKWVETDAQVTRDGAVILMHDDTLARTTNAQALFPSRSPWAVSDFTLAEIRQLDAGAWYAGGGFAGEKVPLLSELLALLPQTGTGLLVELKAAEIITADKVANELQSAQWVVNGVSARPLCVNSFYLSSMKRFQALLPKIEGQLIFAASPTAQQLFDARGIVAGVMVPVGSLADPIYSSGDPLLANLAVYTVGSSRDSTTATTYPQVRIWVSNDVRATNTALGM